MPIEFIHSQGTNGHKEAAGFSLVKKSRQAQPLGHVTFEQYSQELVRLDRFHPFRSFGIGPLTDYIDPSSGMINLSYIGIIESVDHYYRKLGVDFYNAHIREWYGLLDISGEYAKRLDQKGVETSHTLTVLWAHHSANTQREIDYGLSLGKRIIVLDWDGSSDQAYLNYLRERIMNSTSKTPYPSAVITFRNTQELERNLKEAWDPVLRNPTYTTNHWLAGIVPDAVRIYGIHGDSVPVLSHQIDGSIKFNLSE